MSKTVIVALPRVDDKVYKISSEKVPHLTLCYLGEQSDGEQLAEVVTYVQHAASQLSPFGLTVDYRGTLGADEADVLFFENGPFDAERVKDFRHHLLLNDTIKKMYDEQDQYPEWTPHLTLGYPDAPAKEDDSDYPGIHYVSFDRIAVWIGDFEGPEFRLKYDENAIMDSAAWSAMSTSEKGEHAVAELFHYGKKGMRWGVRNNPDGTVSVDQTRVRKSLLNAKDVTVTQRRAGTYVKTKGGKRQVATTDAVRAHAGRQKAKKSTTDALSNKELKDAIERMRLEQEFKKLDAKTKRRGEGFVAKLFQSPEARKTSVDLARKIAKANA